MSRYYTPPPWKAVECEDGQYQIETDYKTGLQDVVIGLGLSGTGGLSKENAELIVKAVNSYAARTK